MAETEFAIAYEGPALEDGRMPVRDLAPALLSLGDLFTQAAGIVYPERPPVTLEIRATQEGSFLVDLILSGPQWDEMVHLFDSDTVNALVNLKELIVAGSAGGLGLFKLIQYLDGRKVASEQPASPGVVRLVLDDGTSLEVPAEVATLQRNVSIRRSARRVIEPVTKDGVEAVRIRSDSQVEVVIGEQDVPAYDVPELEPEPIGEQEFEMVLEIASLAFTEGNKWRLSDGAETFYVTILDESFIERIDNGEPFRKGDRLRCRVRFVQTQRGDQLHAEREVVEVLAHIPAGQQLILPPPDVDADAA